MSYITANVKSLLSELPKDVQLVAAVKSRTADEVREALDAGITIIGENYVQEACALFASLARQVQWHCIGHLQRNKARRAVGLFEMIQTLDSWELAESLERICAAERKKVQVLVEVNSAEETRKSGVDPADVLPLIKKIASLGHVCVQGLMTMGPLTDQKKALRRAFRRTREIFTHLKKEAPANVQMRFLSMGMSDSYSIALEEGANMIRIGTRIFKKN